MGLVPNTKTGKISFYTSKITPWQTNAVAIGTTSAAVTDLRTKLDAASDKLAAQVAAEAAFRTAVSAADDAVFVLANAGADIIKAIRAKAAVTGNSVYDLAQIPPPAIPSPVGPPGTPFQLKVELKPNGSIEMKWKCSNPANGPGTIYHVYRRVNAGDEFVFIGGSGVKDFVDATVPAGVPSITYSIQAVRSTAVGDAAEFIVNFGVTSAGGMTATVTDGPTTKPKMAA